MQPTGHDASDRSRRIQQVLDSYIDRRAAGEPLADDQVLAAHPELMPELGDELRKLALIDRAQQRAHDAGSSSARADVLGEGAPATMDDVDMIPGYEIVGEIRRGGQGVVYEAIQKSTVRKVAVKVMKEGPFAGPGDEARFEREVQILAALNHPRIVTIHDSGTAAGRHYFVMDYVSGRPLDAHMARGEPSIDETLRLFRKICEAVNAAHLRGIIHRDLKPSNIRIDDEGEPRILDFGLAKVLGSSESQEETMTQDGQFLGSLPWASPEQAEGSASKIDMRTDVYSLGVVLYHMLTGRFPYNVLGNIRDVIDRILTAEPVRPSMVRKQINDEVETIVLKCLAKEPERRYQTAGELGRDVKRYLDGEPIEAKRDSAAYVLRKQLRKYRRSVVVAAGFVLLLIGASIALAVQSTRIKREAQATSNINAFLNGMLGSVDPLRLRLLSGMAPDEQMLDLGGGPFRRDISVAEMLRRASDKIPAQFVDKPELEAEVRETIGMTFQSLQLYREAEHQLRAALEIRQNVLGADHPDTLRSQLELGLAIRDSLTGRAADAEPFVQSALDGMRRTYGPEDPKTLTAARARAKVLADQRKYEQSEQIFGKTLKTQRRVLGDGHRDTLMTMHDWAVSKLYAGREDEAAELARELYDICSRSLDPDDSMTIMSQMVLGVFEARQARYPAAEDLLRTGLEKCRRVLGPDHPYTFLTMRALARSLWGADRQEEKEELYREAMEGQLATVGRNYDETIATIGNFAWFLCTQRRYDEAIKLQEPLVEMLVQERGEDDLSTFIAMKILSRALLGAGKLDEARDCTVRTIAIGERLAALPDAPPYDLGHCAWFLLTCEPADLRDPEEALLLAERAVELSNRQDTPALEILAEAYRATGDLDKAVDALRRARALLPPGVSPTRILFETKLIALLRQRGDHAGAEAVLQDFISRMREAHGEQHAVVAGRTAELAVALLNAGQSGMHLRVCSELTILYPSQPPGEYDDIARLGVWLGSTLMEENRYAEAEPILRAALGLRQVTLPADHLRIANTMSVLGASLVGQGRFDDAEPFLIEACEKMSWLPASSEFKQQAMERLVELYEAWNKPQQAAEWRAKLPTTQPTSGPSDRATEEDGSEPPRP